MSSITKRNVEQHYLLRNTQNFNDILVYKSQRGRRSVILMFLRMYTKVIL